MLPLKTSRSLKSARSTQSRFANINRVRLHYLFAGKGDPVILLHGYAETSHMWRPLMAKLADTHTVIARDLRGAGQSSTSVGDYTKAAMAQDIHALVSKLGRKHFSTEEQHVTSGGLTESPGGTGVSKPISGSEVASEARSVVGLPKITLSATKSRVTE
jgi:hypothetical protein